MSQTFNKLPSEIYNVEGAAGYCFDRGIFLFGQHVESVMSQAEQGASNAMYARSARARAFARCMGDDMEKSNAGFADPFASGARFVDADGKSAKAKPKDDILWTEGG